MNESPDPPTQDDTVGRSDVQPDEHGVADKIEIESAGLSDLGGRTSNEDQFVIAHLSSTGTVEESGLASRGPICESGPRVSLLLVADGLGGQASGEVASSLAARMALRSIVESGLGAPWELVLSAAIGGADRAVLARAKAEPSNRGMATTMTVALIDRARLVIGHAGDSRAYLLRGGLLGQLTRDHTLAETVAEAEGDPGQIAKLGHLRNMLVNVVGGDHDGVSVDIVSHPLHDGDRILLCSDGLYGVVPDERITLILGEAESSRSACKTLVRAAVEGGTRDNVTVVVAIVRAANTVDDMSTDDTAKMFLGTGSKI